MKKILTIVALSLATAVAAHAQFGIMGGFTSSSSFVDTQNAMGNIKNVNLYHAGIAYKIKMGPVFVLQPALAYQMKGANLHQTVSNIQLGQESVANVVNSFESRTGYVELSLGAQVGLDLLAFRPYLLVEPFIGYAVYNSEIYNYSGEALRNLVSIDQTEDYTSLLADAKNKLEGGFGIGAGVELVHHVQLSLQWYMNLGNLFNDGKLNETQLMDNLKNNYKDIHNYHGLKLTLGVFF